jgi:hypothetical protein
MPADLIMERVQEWILNLRPSFKNDYLRSEVLSKYVSSTTDSALIRQTRAVNKWLATERENEATNDRLWTTHEDFNIIPRVSFTRFITFCRDLIIEIIGETAPIESLIGTFSGGASTSRNRTESHPANKYLGRAHVTSRALELWQDIIAPEILGWTSDPSLEYEVVQGNVMFTVPKKTDIDRVACKEPDINMFVQKGIGSFFRESLRVIGINLNDQSINRKLARIGSIDDSLATLDLSSASDSVTTGLVELLLPVCWYTLLDSVRSPVTTLPSGETHRNEMFSSMGNGYTFELESLLFYVLTRATAYFTGTSGRISVYGDDIICPSSMIPQLTYVLQYMGFSVNPDKSFSSGPFRESCGGHYYNGFDITPFYIRKPIDTLVDVIHLANSLREWASTEAHSINDDEAWPLWSFLASFVPRRLWGGDNTSFKYQLVSSDCSHSRLQEETRRRGTGTGGYYHWLNATWDRELLREGVATSSKSNGANKFRIRSVREQAVPRLPSVFYQELEGSFSAVSRENIHVRSFPNGLDRRFQSPSGSRSSAE